MFSKACEYGIRAVIYVAAQSLLDKKVSVKMVAKAIDSPEAYTSKILQLLSRSQVIASGKGPTGGYSMDKKKLGGVTLGDIVVAIDGDEVYHACGLGLKECNEKMPCPVHSRYSKIREELVAMLETTSVQDLAMGTKKGESYLKRK